MARELIALLILALGFSGCASGPPHAAPQNARPFDDVRRLAIVSLAPGAFTLIEHRSEPGRTLDEVLSWHPYGPALRPLAKLVHQGISSVLKVDQEAAVARDVDDVKAEQVVAEAMTRRLRASGYFDEVRVLANEPVGEALPRGEAIVRVTVTSWGLVRVRDSAPDLLSSFSDVAGSLSVPGTGVVLWEHREDVTGPDQIPFESFRRNRQFAREQMVGVLDRAGERLAGELLYARSSGR